MDFSQVRSGRGSRRLDCFFGIWQHVKRIQRKLSRPTSELSRQRCGRGRGNRDLLVRRTGSGTTSMFPPGAVQPPKRGKVAPFVSMWLLESFRNEPKVLPKTPLIRCRPDPRASGLHARLLRSHEPEYLPFFQYAHSDVASDWSDRYGSVPRTRDPKMDHAYS